MTSRTKIKTGTIGQFMAWTKKVVRDPSAVAKAEPGRWRESAEEIGPPEAGAFSAEAIVKLLSAENIEVLDIIRRRKPKSLRRLAELAGREESNVSRTLKKLEKAGIVTVEAGPGRVRRPVLVARKVRLELDLAGGASRLRPVVNR
jgi:predicted transcriptional regulator